MHLFWKPFIEPTLEIINTQHLIVEVGSSSGVNTKNILEFCQRTKSRCIAIDPLEIGNIKEISPLLAQFGEHKKDLSLNVLPHLPLASAYMIDGDHNYYTVRSECEIIFSSCDREKNYSSILFFHDVAWPYGRRDMYYNKATVPQEQTQPTGPGGVRPGVVALDHSGGLNPGMDQALREGGPRNGVLTGIEDAMKAHPRGEWQYFELPSFFGLGVVVSPLGHSAQTWEKIQKIFHPEPRWIEHLKELDQFRLQEIIQLSDEKQKLLRMYQELFEKLKQSNERIQNLFEENAVLKNPVGRRARWESLKRALNWPL